MVEVLASPAAQILIGDVLLSLDVASGRRVSQGSEVWPPPGRRGLVLE